MDEAGEKEAGKCKRRSGCLDRQVAIWRCLLERIAAFDGSTAAASLLYSCCQMSRRWCCRRDYRTWPLWGSEDNLWAKTYFWSKKVPPLLACIKSSKIIEWQTFALYSRVQNKYYFPANISLMSFTGTQYSTWEIMYREYFNVFLCFWQTRFLNSGSGSPSNLLLPQF
jgi:hypothetical protein